MLPAVAYPFGLPGLTAGTAALLLTAWSRVRMNEHSTIEVIATSGAGLMDPKLMDNHQFPAYYIPVTLPAPRELLRKAARGFVYLAGFFIFAAVVNYFQSPGTGDLAPLQSLPLTSMSGERLQVSVASGKKTVIYFFAPWCAVCKVSMDALNFFEGSERVQTLAVGLDYDTIAELKPFQEKLSTPIYAGDVQLQRRFKIDRYPTAYILNGDGSVAHAMVGYTSRFGIWIRTLL
jgi:thiol-disulfide isomerase/thioredoxin